MRDILFPLAERIARATYQLGQHTHGWDDASPAHRQLYADAIENAIGDTQANELSAAETRKPYPVLMEGNVELADLRDADLPRIRRVLGDLNGLAWLGRVSLEIKEGQAAEPAAFEFVDDSPNHVGESARRLVKKMNPTPNQIITSLVDDPMSWVEICDRVTGRWQRIHVKLDAWKRFGGHDTPRYGYRLVTEPQPTEESFTVTLDNAHKLVGRSTEGHKIAEVGIGEQEAVIWKRDGLGILHRHLTVPYGNVIELDLP